jgi:enamine deaminase RidA (YjgF/YER057c/UK114 family)
MSPEDRLREIGISLDSPVKPVGNYVAALTVGDFVYQSGAVPLVDGGLPEEFSGLCDKDVPVEKAREAARITAINLLCNLKAEIGDLAKVDRIVRISGFIASDPGFTGQPGVLNGASDFLVEVFGESGKHTREAVGAAVLPLNSVIEISMITKLRR